MCGILAIVNNKNTFNDENVKNALDIGKNRGPESTTLEQVENMQFGFHRLAINGMDTESGQPMKIDNITLICNGEIFNYKELFKQIGISPKTNSDCEVIIHLYKKYGIEHTLRLLDGEFAFAICDARDPTTTLFHYARDPYGVRPLYILEESDDYMQEFNAQTIPKIRIIHEKVFAVASELKALHKLKYKDGRFIYREDKTHLTYIKGNSVKSLKQFLIKHVLPGTFSTYNKTNSTNGEWVNVVKNRIYHTMPLPTTAIATETVSVHDYKVGICKMLNAAVMKRVVGTSDRPIACLLSGGLDSSLTTALVNKYYKKIGGELETYSIGMEGSEDLRHARIVANHLGTKHTEIIMTPEQFFDAIPSVIRDIESYDTTSVRASVGNYLIGKYIAAHSNAKVILNGDGSDELTGGYIYMLKAPDNIEFDRETRRLLTDIHLFDVLRSDKSMSCHGLEPRTPFLDKYFVDYYLRIPVEVRTNITDANGKRIEKYLLRQAFQENEPDLLPSEILWRNKEAFSDGVSGKTGSWFEYIQAKVDKMIIENGKNGDTVHQINPPKTKEQVYYRSIFEKVYPDSASIVPYFWMPKYVNTDDCSALTIKKQVYA
jgi:asparagine synthase (glutamine-hydrolysing)